MSREQLPYRETLYSLLFDLNPFPAVVSRLADHAVVAVNARTAEVIGMAQEDAIGLTVTDFYVNPADRIQIADTLRRAGRADKLRVQIKRADGQPFWALASFRMISWQGDLAVLSMFHDITEQVGVEESLLASERRLVAQSDALTALTTRYVNPDEPADDRIESILKLSAEALGVDRLSVWRFDDGRVAIRCWRLYRRSDDRYDTGSVLEAHDFPRYFAALERERVVAAEEAQTDPRTSEFTSTYLQPNGIGAMLDVPLRHDLGTVGVLCAEHVGGVRRWTVDEQNFAISVANLVVVAIIDEERRRALARLAESEARSRLVIDTAHDAFIGIDSAGNISAWNAQAEQTFGWTRDEALSRNLADTIIPPAFREAHNNGLRRFHETGEAPVVNQRLELTAMHRSGHEFPVELTITSPMRAEQGGFFFAAFLRDISARRERDTELRQAKESAEAATRAKSEFLANMSHELRTPLNGVLGYAQLLQRDRTLSGNQREALEAIAKCGAQLLELINDVLDLSKIEAGRLEIEEVPTDLAKLVTDLRYVFAESADRKGLRLTMSIGPDVPRSVVLDDRHLRQVLLNLLGNAIKFTATGEVRLAVTRAGDERLHFEVADTGCGIEPDALTEIFAAFKQTKTGAAAGGTGLGLTISRHLIARMYGDLKVESTLGEGSRFWFDLPLIQGDEAAPPIGPDLEPLAPPLDSVLAPGQSITALVVDDSAANRAILSGLLESAGVRVVTASGGVEGVELAHTRRPAVVFMDLKMDDLDGLEATRRLAADPTTAMIPVIAVTASALGDIRQIARDAGCVDYLSKPIRAQSLFAMLQRHVGVRFVSAAEVAAKEDPETLGFDRRVAVASRLRTAVAIGDVGDIQALARLLMEGDAAETAVGERINKLAAHFDFTALAELADSLAV